MLNNVNYVSCINSHRKGNPDLISQLIMIFSVFLFVTHVSQYQMCITAATSLGCFVKLWNLERSQYHYSDIYTYLDSLFNRLFGLTSKKILKLCITGPMLLECPSQRASNAESVSMSWYHHVAPLLSEHRRTVTEEDIQWNLSITTTFDTSLPS